MKYFKYLKNIFYGLVGRKERPKKQLTPTELISALKKIPSGTEVANLIPNYSSASYWELPLILSKGLRPADDLIIELRSIVESTQYPKSKFAKVLVIYNGGAYRKLTAVHAGGEIETEE